MRSNHLFLAAVSGLILLGGCSKAPTDSAASAEATAAAAKADAAAAEEAAATKAKEAELAQREAELAAREAELAAANAAKTRPAARPPAAGKPATSVVNNASPPAKPVPVTPPPAAPLTLTVPNGTQLSLALTSPLTSKTAKVGDTVSARVTQDVRVNDRVAIAAGTTVAGQVTDVISGSSKIGGVPTLGLRFERLELPGGADLPIDGTLTQKGKSDTGRDTAKIVGGAAAGAILGNQVKGGDKGKVLGGLLGGAIGAVAAQKTGTEVTLAEGTEFAITLNAPVEITRR